MPEETEVKQEETKVEESKAEETQVEETQQVEEAHPLEPGGKRFSEVYGEMKDARREAQELRERLARVEGQLTTQPKPTQPEPRFYTSEQLQAAVDKGTISPAQMSDQLAWQRSQQMSVELERKFEAKQRSTEALAEINQYVNKVPELMNSSSKEFAAVGRAAREIASEMGRGVDDPIVQRRALREALGDLTKLTQVRQAVGSARTHINMDDGARGAGGAGQVSNKPDPLKDIPQMYKDHWKRLGYDQKRMEEEAKYIKPRRPRV